MARHRGVRRGERLSGEHASAILAPIVHVRVAGGGRERIDVSERLAKLVGDAMALASFGVAVADLPRREDWSEEGAALIHPSGWVYGVTE